MKSKFRASIVIVIVVLVVCGITFAQFPQLSPVGLRGIRPRGLVTSSQLGAAAVHQSTAAGALETSNVSLTWGIYTFPGALGSYTAAVTESGHTLGAYGAGINVDEPPNYGFILKGTKFTTLSYPGAAWTQPNAINDEGVVVGGYGASLTSFTDEHGFKLADGTYTSLDYPGATATAATGINKHGEIVGEWFDTAGGLHGFLLAKNVFTSVDVPNATYTVAWGINNAGEIAGFYGDSNGNSHGFLLQSGTFTTFDYPGYSQNYVADINDNGVIAGSYGEPLMVNGVEYLYEHSYVYQNGTFTTVDAPFGPPAATEIWHLNDSGVITGLYADDTSTSYGFEATLPQ